MRRLEAEAGGGGWRRRLEAEAGGGGWRRRREAGGGGWRLEAEAEAGGGGGSTVLWYPALMAAVGYSCKTGDHVEMYPVGFGGLIRYGHQ